MKNVIFYIQIKKLGGGTDAASFYKHKENDLFFVKEVSFKSDIKPSGYIDVHGVLYVVKQAVYNFELNTYYCLVNKA